MPNERAIAGPFGAPNPDTNKVAKPEANYRPAPAEPGGQPALQDCSGCLSFEAGPTASSGPCTVTEGVSEQGFICDLFQPATLPVDDANQLDRQLFGDI